MESDRDKIGYRGKPWYNFDVTIAFDSFFGFKFNSFHRLFEMNVIQPNSRLFADDPFRGATAQRRQNKWCFWLELIVVLAMKSIHENQGPTQNDCLFSLRCKTTDNIFFSLFFWGYLFFFVYQLNWTRVVTTAPHFF